MSLWDEARWSCAALVTPVGEGGAIEVGRLAGFGRRLLVAGLNGLVPFGTMGEGPAFTVAARLEAVAGLVERGLEPGRLVLGIGANAVADMAWLARTAGELRLAAVLATPPFFFRDVPQEGVFRAYAELVEAAGPEAPPLLLYHIPQVTGVRAEAETVARLVDAFPGRVRGIKDSEASPTYTRALLERVADRAAVLVGAEALIPEAVARGARGTVCGMANVIPSAIARLVAGEEEPIQAVHRLGEVLRRVPVIPSVKAAVGERLGEAGWRACMPPLLPVGNTEAGAVAVLGDL